MIVALLRLGLIWFIVLTVFYLLLRVYFRSLRRERLEKKWAAEGLEGDREGYIREGMDRYDASLASRLLWGVYIIPSVIAGVTFYFINLD